MPVLYVVACGGRPAGDLPDFVTHCQARSWDVCVVASPAGLRFMDASQLHDLTGHAVRYDYKKPDEPDVLPPADAFVAAPTTFNTLNKWVAGISDTLVLGLLNEAIGLRLPIVCAPWPNLALARHPTFLANIETLRSWGVTVIFDPERRPLPVPNMGPAGNVLFPWKALRETVDDLTTAPARAAGCP